MLFKSPTPQAIKLAPAPMGRYMHVILSFGPNDAVEKVVAPTFLLRFNRCIISIYGGGPRTESRARVLVRFVLFLPTPDIKVAHIRPVYCLSLLELARILHPAASEHGSKCLSMRVILTIAIEREAVWRFRVIITWVYNYCIQRERERLFGSRSVPLVGLDVLLIRDMGFCEPRR